MNYSSAPAGEVLENLLSGTDITVVSAGSDQVVLAPSRANPNADVVQQKPQMLSSVGQLDRIVVTGSSNGSSQRGLPIAVDVIERSELSQRTNGSLSSVLNGNVPGVWLWDQSPLSLLARYGSIRGASSFGVSYPKVYVDGIEVANSLLVTQLDPDAIARIEVIRGPQGAALYGADAISGVINIVTRQEGTEGGSPKLQLRATGGGSASDFNTSSVFDQRHSLSYRSGTGTQSARFGLTLGRIGAFIPDAYSQQVTANAGGRIVKSKMILTGTGRFFAENARTPGSPLLSAFATSAVSSAQSDVQSGRFRGSATARPDTLHHIIPDSSDRQMVRQYTLGGAATFISNERWTQSVTAGVDGYSLRSATVLDGAFPSAIDSALHASQGNALRTTLRASSVGQIFNSGDASASVTFAAEHSFVRDATNSTTPFAYDRPAQKNGSPPPLTSTVDTRSNTGLVSQLNGSYRDTWYASGGLRLERNTGFTVIGDFSLLPMVGAAYVHDIGLATLKLRSAYGKGIRPPRTSSRSGTLMGLERTLASTLSNEEQSGTELGADLFFRKNISAHVTRFDQTASGLIQPVTVTPPGWQNSGPNRRIAYQLQNVGEIGNSGWELEGRVGGGPIGLSGTFTQTKSTVEQIAKNYTGDLRVGDRMLEVPARTMGITASITQGKVFASGTLSRASDWINYDRIALAAAYANTNHDLREFVGPQLRTYWRPYDGVTRMGANVALNLSRGLSVLLAGENLLNEQRGEPDNITVLPGRTVTGGMRFSF